MTRQERDMLRALIDRALRAKYGEDRVAAHDDARDEYRAAHKQEFGHTPARPVPVGAVERVTVTRRRAGRRGSVAAAGVRGNVEAIAQSRRSYGPNRAGGALGQT